MTVRFPALQVASTDSKTSNRQNGGLDGGLDDALDKRILTEIRSDPSLTQKELSDITNIPLRTIQRKLREMQDKYLYDEFISIGGEPETNHPLSFVIEGSKYLEEWFGKGIETRIPIAGISEKHISFTLGDSGAEYGRNGSVKLLGLHEMTELLAEQTGDFNDFLNTIGKQYVEVQLWSDRYIVGAEK